MYELHDLTFTMFLIKKILYKFSVGKVYYLEYIMKHARAGNL